MKLVNNSTHTSNSVYTAGGAPEDASINTTGSRKEHVSNSKYSWAISILLQYRVFSLFQCAIKPKNSFPSYKTKSAIDSSLTSPKARSKHDVSFIKPRAIPVVRVSCRTSNTSRNNCMMGERESTVLNLQKEKPNCQKQRETYILLHGSCYANAESKPCQGDKTVDAWK